ncbi:hypothetical protein PRIC2_007184 [Phytophthora ramorum]|uniref:uncharacterized protein n=1 Tax=Phytophthora ramorum TaxID=164328 RepID=UPI003099675D|nr:hypothetical protein KRP23_2226 [Phytophthora ramorum]
MRGDDIVKDSTAAEATTSKKEKGDKPRAKRTRRQFREDAQRAQAHAQPQAQEVQDVRSDADGAERELIRSDSATSLSPSAIVEMFHLQGDENSRVISGATTARYLVENEVSGDFYQVRLMRKLSRMDHNQGYEALGNGAVAELTSYRMLQAATALMSTALLVLLIESPSALRLSRAQQSNATWCEDVAPVSDIFQRRILTLQVCAILNTALITAAWLLVALQCSATMSSTSANRNRIMELQETLSAHEKRVDELEGTHLDGASVEDLKSLIQLHHRAIELTEGVLVAKLQAQHRPTAAS